MYLLSNGELCPKTKRKAQYGNYIVAIIEQGKGYRISLIDSRNNCEAVSNFRFDYDKALDVASKTFDMLIKSQTPLS